MINFHGAAKRLEDLDLPRIGERIGVGEDEIHAVLAVESRGSGFDKHGRPLILFEPHIFDRNLPKEKRAKARITTVRIDDKNWSLSYPSWQRGYPSDSYPRLLKAMEIDETAALKSASWGLGQVLGDNFKAAGYTTVQAMVQACTEDEEHHLEQMINFIKANHLDDELRRHDWRAFARGYNGPGYEKNNYHTRLAAAFAKWQRIKDTPYRKEDIRRVAEVETEMHEAA